MNNSIARKIIYSKIKPIPSLIFSLFPVLKNLKNITTEIRRKIAGTMKLVRVSFIGEIIATIPRTKVKFVNIPPVMFPIAMLLCFNLQASIPNINSGKTVAREIMNNPTTISGIPKSEARDMPDLTANLDEKNNIIKAKIKVIKISSALFILPFSSFSGYFFLFSITLVKLKIKNASNIIPSILDRELPSKNNTITNNTAKKV